MRAVLRRPVVSMIDMRYPLRMLSSATPDNTVDVAIVGGGMVGGLLAALLRHNPLTEDLNVMLIDQKAQAMDIAPQDHPELRVSTVTPASIAAMKQAGAWEMIAPHAKFFSHMQVWDTAGSGHIRWNASDVGSEHMGCVVENSVLQAAFLKASQQGSTGGNLGGGVQLAWPTNIEELKLPYLSQQTEGASRPGTEAEAPAMSSLAKISLQGGKTVHARLVVAADGSNSKIRQMAGFRTSGWQYNQRALVATVQTSEQNDTAWQRFLPSGPLALLPVRGGFSNIVWSTTPEAAKKLESLPPTEFADVANRALNDAFESSAESGSGIFASLGALAETGTQALSSLGGSGSTGADSFQSPPQVLKWVGPSPKSFPLQLKHSARYVAPRVALIGDAAHAVHPLAGQGVNLGFGDAEALASAIAAARRCGADIGDDTFLRETFEKPRLSANLTMITALDVVRSLFKAQATPMGKLRNLGLSMINHSGSMKNQFMRAAMGI